MQRINYNKIKSSETCLVLTPFKSRLIDMKSCIIDC